MTLQTKWTDLRFVIGSFLTIIGILVLGAFLLSHETASNGIHVNLLGGALLTITGITLALSSLRSSDVE